MSAKPRVESVSGAAEPRRVGTYEILLDLGSGGMGTIHLARAVGDAASGFERFVAIKRTRALLQSDAEALRRFLDEAKLAALVHHANVVGIHHVGKDADGPFLVLDYVEGDTLDALVDYAKLRARSLSPPVVLRVVLDALSGLHAVHETSDAAGRPLRMLHRDVAPQNLMVGCDGVTRLTDFGIAKAAISSVDTDQAYLQGRLAFLAPEYLRRERVDRRLDVYAMGVTLWVALVGRLPWPDASEAQLVLNAVERGIPKLSSVGFTIAPAIEAIVARACERDPERRFPSARAMLETTEEVGRHTGWIASHAEVAELVRDLAGPDLAARRAAIAAVVRGGAKAGGAADSEPEERRRLRPSLRRTWVAVAGAASILAALAVGLSFARGRAGSVAPERVPADRVEPPPPVGPSPRASSPIAPSSSSAEPAVAASATAQASASGAPPAPPSSPPPRPAASSRSTAPPPRPAAKDPRTSVGITTSNPYR
jgi:eukaryotic-like serine/threonine-protein kinase